MTVKRENKLEEIIAKGWVLRNYSALKFPVALGITLQGSEMQYLIMPASLGIALQDNQS